MVVVYDDDKEKFKYINKDGNLAIQEYFDKASNFKGELARITCLNTDKYAFINKKGDIVFEIPMY